ncbi:MAG TPA: YicC/YloC family endoribonuclease [Mobilitalea sp.]|nr:YicC/YloC family endoribonuclease [Mobilitalea sp.]
MLKSMTGFGRNEIALVDRKITVEMKAVNHRYCDISIKMPKKLSFFEAGIRNVLKQYIGRGKIDVFINYEDYTENNVCVKYNSELAREYLTNLDKMSKDFGIENDIRVSALSRYPEVFTLEEQTIDEKELWEMVEEAVKGAASRFVETRIAEGENLKKDIIDKLDGMLSLVDFIETRSPEIVSEYRKKLMAKVTDLLGDTKVDESILVTEVTIFADKICVDEETVRLKSHINNMKLALSESENVGRKLDFIAQEMNREANTILSKASDLEVTNKAIDLKTEIEKIREQIQNIE